MNILIKLSNWYFSRKALPYWYILALDCLIVLFSIYAGAYIDYDGNSFMNDIWNITRGAIPIILIFVVLFKLFSTYSGVLRYSSFVDLQRIAYANAIASILTMVLSYCIDEKIEWLVMLKWEGVIVMGIISTLLMLVLRVIVKSVFDQFRRDENTRKVFIYGVKEGGVSLAKSIQNQMPQQYQVKGFISPDGQMVANVLMGAKVFPDNNDIIDEMLKVQAKSILVSPLQSEHFRQRDELVNALIDNGIKILMMSSAEEWDGKSALQHTQLHEVEIEDLLPREKIEVDMEAIGALLKNKKILITGAAGSIGSEIVRQVAKFNPARMILIDQAETPMHDVRLMMAREHSQLHTETIVASITDVDHMEKIFSDHKPDFVFHAAAYKHVPMMEDNPAQAVRNNIYGTRVIADLAVKYGTKKFVIISTDKAVNPTNVMGCSKRICEIYCQSLNNAIAQGKVEGVTQFVTTRFGNVLGSNGSVIPIFKEQIKKGGPITVTHPDIIRFFMLIPEACRLVLEAGTMGHGGEIFVFDMGEPVRIVDLAKRMISLSGAKNVKIEFTGLRDGEKLYEEVLNVAETTKPTVHPKINVAQVREYDYEEAQRNEDELYQLSFTHDDMRIVAKMKEIVPEYKSKHSKYESLDK